MNRHSIFSISAIYLGPPSTSDGFSTRLSSSTLFIHDIHEPMLPRHDTHFTFNLALNFTFCKTQSTARLFICLLYQQVHEIGAVDD